MGRWEPNPRGRLEQAAMELYAERGFEQTTVAEIAERAGLTKRTFFRHFTDKRDILFAGAARLQELIVNGVAGAPESLAPIAAVAMGLVAATELIKGFAEGSAARQAIIAANPELQERELVKFATLAAAIAEVLRERGVADRSARLTAEAGIAAFKIAFEYWITDPDRLDFARLIHESLADLKALTAGQLP